jgi:baculoviral IAP repeat-containing protein 6
MISGPKDTPYENGLFFFNGYFPEQYPNSEPKVLLETTGSGAVRFNPNLYANGKVCLSLLGTWSGDQNEKWNSKTSSFLQVLVSIQSLIFVEQPYFNEPGYERQMGTPDGDRLNFEYNEILRYHTIELAIIDQIKHGSHEFKEVIENHFRIKKNDILLTCKKWVNESTKYKIKMNEIYKKLEETLNNI